jgi:hypothetical protein
VAVSTGFFLSFLLQTPWISTVIVSSSQAIPARALSVIR